MYYLYLHKSWTPVYHMSKPNAFSLMMKAPQPTDQKTTGGYAIIKGSCRTEEQCYLLQFDGLSEPNPGTSTGGAVLFSPHTRVIVFEVGKFIDYGTNNQAEYTGLLIGLKAALEKDVREILIEGDSQLVIFQTEGRWKVKNDVLQVMNREARDLITQFEFAAIRHIYRDKNAHADRITNEVLRRREGYYR